VVNRSTKTYRYWVVEHADKATRLRTYLRPFRGVHKYFLAEYVATFETLMNAKRITPAVVKRMCFGAPLHASTS
jgi:transposase-like protein